ncbi:hypothetical protein DSM104299_04109 [Baekduia alba]|nr:hypothetical protein DSM104299_04109 [Baekduia alba]
MRYPTIAFDGVPAVAVQDGDELRQPAMDR